MLCIVYNDSNDDVGDFSFYEICFLGEMKILNWIYIDLRLWEFTKCSMTLRHFVDEERKLKPMKCT